MLSSPAINSATAMRWNQVNIYPVMTMGNNRRLDLHVTFVCEVKFVKLILKIVNDIKRQMLAGKEFKQSVALLKTE